MKSLLSSSHTGMLEPLESRIAPATIFIGAPDGTPVDTPRDTEYVEGNPTPEFQAKFFVNTTTAVADPIAAALNANSGNTFFLRLQAGDQVQAFTLSQSYSELIRVDSGFAIAFFTDLNGNNNYDDYEFTGLALGKDAKVVVSSNVNGDILTNLNTNGTSNPADDTLDMTGLVNAKQGIASLEVRGGSVFGSVYSGGDIKNLFLSNNVHEVLAGSAANGASFDFFTGSTGGKGLIGFTPAAGQIGASISNAKIGSIGEFPGVLPVGVPLQPLPAKVGILEAGGGGFGAKGGSLNGIEISKDVGGFQLLAGKGGNGDAGAKKAAGGAGGDVNNVYVSGVVDPTPNSVGGIVIKSGAGGDALNTATGGAGGKMTNVFVGFELNAGKRISSGDLLSDSVRLESGAGGSGKTGGAGGQLSNSLVQVQTPDVNGDEIALISGAGGANVDPGGGKAGVGGLITAVDVRNQVSTFNSDIVVRAGDGGTTVGLGVGAVGGSITNSTVLGFDLQIIAGNGSDGKTGANGGSITGLTIADGFAGLREIVAHNVLLNAGRGGNGSAGNGGNAGNITNVSALKTDLQSFNVNSGIQGNGGTSANGKGGLGSSITNLTIFDGDTGFGLAGDVILRAGKGGDGTKGGNNGGSMSKVVVAALNANITASSGSGGDALVNGKGGNAGTLMTSDFTTKGQVNGMDVFGDLSTGVGGDGLGKGNAGGFGGDFKTVNLAVDGSAKVIAGMGGSGETIVGGGAAGKGGSVILTGAFALNGSGEMRAGNAGAGGAKPGNGGSILGSTSGAVSPTGTISGLLASTSLAIVAGNGTHGGTGGDIKGVGFGSTAESLTPTPDGDILVQAGNGSAEGKTAGKGGSLDGIFGSISSGVGSKTELFGGDGGGVIDKAAPGGSVSNVDITFGGGQDVVFRIEAGDAGDAANVTTGQKGGDVRGINVISIDDLTILRSLAGGDGGDAKKTGGNGGTIDNVHVFGHDIGLRTGAAFGYTAMGGLFAGLGGAAAAGGKAGLAGNVTNISADSIASIVAGRGFVPQFAEKVENIYLNGDKQLVVRDEAFAENAPFTLTFQGNTTGLIPKDAVPAVVAQQLNLLPSIINAGGVTVQQGAVVDGFPTYRVVWNLTGDEVLLTGLEQQPVAVTEAVRGEIIPFTSFELVPGAKDLNVTDVVPGERNLPILETIPGNTPVNATEVTRGDAVTQEEQELSMLQLASFAGSQFILNFQGDNSAPLPANATAAQIDAALEGLLTIQALGGVGGNVVTVTQSAPFIFEIKFNIFQDVPDVISAALIIPETQRLSLGDLAAFPGSMFDLSFKKNGNTQTTVQLPANATAAQIETALDAITTANAGGVTVIGGPGGVFDIRFNNIGDQPALIAHGYVHEVQSLDFDAIPAGGEILLGYGANFTTVPAGSAAAAVQVALNALPSIQATGPGNTGAVTVVPGPNNTFTVEFNTNGDKFPISVDGLQEEKQSLDLGRTGAAETGEFLINVSHLVPVFEGVKGTENPLFVTNLVQGAVGAALVTTTTPGNNTTPEVQQLDLTGVIGIPSGEFRLFFNGVPTAFLPRTATAAQIDAALDPIVVGGVTVAATLGGLFQFDITFNTNGDKAQITVESGARERQNIDLDTLTTTPGGEFVVHFLTDTSAPIPAGATAAQVQTALNNLPLVLLNGGVTVTASLGSSFNVQFNNFAIVPDFTGEGGGTASHETQLIDLSAFDGVANTQFTLVFGSSATTPLTGASTAADIQTALNALADIQDTRSDGTGAVTVTETGANTGQYIIVFNIFGDQTSLGGSGNVNGGQTIRLQDDATAAQIKAAVDAVSLVPVDVLPTANPDVFNISFNENADQPLLQVTGFIHEVQNVDIFVTGDFNLRFGTDVTPVLPANATAQQVEDALNLLPSIKALRPGNTGMVDVTVGPNSSFNVVLNGDGDVNPIAGIQFEPLTVTTVQNGTAALREIQQVAYLEKGAFDPTTFREANLVGAVADINELGANLFRSFTDGNGNGVYDPGVDLLHVGTFVLGDIPIDGIVMAKFFNQKLVNFTPEAKLTPAGFFDNDNLI